MLFVYIGNSWIRLADHVYEGHEFREEVLPTIKLAQKALLSKTKELALSSAHGVAFHRGLGTPLHPTSSTPLSKYLHEDSIADFADAAYAKSNIAVVANGASHSELSKWVGRFFGGAPSTAPSSSPKLESPPSTYYGGEERIAHDSGNAMVIAFPGSSSFTAGSSYKPEISVLASLLGGQSSIKWSPGFSLLARGAALHPSAHVATTHSAYSDAGLLAVTLTGAASDIRGASGEVVKALRSVAAGETSKEDLKKAIALAKFRALDAGQDITAGLELTGAGLVQGGKAFQMDEVAKGVDGVTPDQLKKVSFPAPKYVPRYTLTLIVCRLLRSFLTVRRLCLPWEISSFCHMRKKSDCMCEVSTEGHRIVQRVSNTLYSLH